MKQLGLEVSHFQPTALRLGEQGKSPLYAAIDGRLAAIIAVADPIKETTPEAIKALHSLGLKVAMITGDNAATAAAIAKQLGIDEVAAEVLPDGKVAALKQFRSNGNKVAFVGMVLTMLLHLPKPMLGWLSVREQTSPLKRQMWS